MDMPTEELCSSTSSSHRKEKKKIWYKGGRSRPNRRKRRNTGRSKMKHRPKPKSCEDNGVVYEYNEPTFRLPHNLEGASNRDYPLLRPLNECKWFWENCRRMSEWKAHFQLDFWRSHWMPSSATVDLGLHEGNGVDRRPVFVSNSFDSQVCYSGIENRTDLCKTSSRVPLPMWLDGQHERNSMSNYTYTPSKKVHSNVGQCKLVGFRNVQMNNLPKIGLNRSMSSRIQTEPRSSLDKQSNVQAVASASCTSTSTERVRGEESFEFHVNEEMLAFFEQSIKHKMELRKQREKEKIDCENTKKQFEFDSTKCPQHITKQRLAEMKLLYGIASPKIVAMETALHLTFERRLSQKKSKLWPIVPLKL